MGQRDRSRLRTQVVVARRHGGRSGGRHLQRHSRRRLGALSEPFGIGKDTVARMWCNHNLKP